MYHVLSKASVPYTMYMATKHRWCLQDYQFKGLHETSAYNAIGTLNLCLRYLADTMIPAPTTYRADALSPYCWASWWHLCLRSPLHQWLEWPIPRGHLNIKIGPPYWSTSALHIGLRQPSLFSNSYVSIFILLFWLNYLPCFSSSELDQLVVVMGTPTRRRARNCLWPYPHWWRAQIYQFYHHWDPPFASRLPLPFLLSLVSKVLNLRL